MILHGVGGEAQELHPSGLEFRVVLRNLSQLGGAHGCVVTCSQKIINIRVQENSKLKDFRSINELQRKRVYITTLYTSTTKRFEKHEKKILDSQWLISHTRVREDDGPAILAVFAYIDVPQCGVGLNIRHQVSQSKSSSHGV